MEWNEKGTADFSPDSKLMSWSINTQDQIFYGSGSKNLIDALAKSYRNIRASVSMVLQGLYGDDVPDTSFIVIGSDIKGGFFNYNFIDFYLGSVPIEWDWIWSFNNSLDKLSSFNRKASSYRLKQYDYYVWEGKEDIQIRNGIIGGIGRNGLENKNWHSFEGLILNKADLDVKYILNEEDSWKASYADFSCPKNYLEEFLVCCTNPMPSYEEIQKGELVGIRRPKIYLFGFEGRGGIILAISIHGISIMKQDSLI
jgi:hypothetical protein